MGKQPHGIHIDIRADSYPISVKRQEYETDQASLSNGKVKKNGIELPLPHTPSRHDTYHERARIFEQGNPHSGSIQPRLSC